jgi:trk system potassium uptake protein TrkH
MNYPLIAKYLGKLCLALAVLMAVPAAWAVYFSEGRALEACLATAVASGVLGGLLLLAGRHAQDQMFEREALTLVGVGWLLTTVIGAGPFLGAGVLTPLDAWFESVSGFTTTGSTVIADIEATAKSILFWRSFTHFLGGMGIVVIFIAVLPYLGAGGRQLLRSESSAPDLRSLRPRIRDTASILFKVYVTLTVIQAVLLMMAGMTLFDALCHAFGTLASGGFSPRQASIGAFRSLPIELITIVFMLAAGTNFGLFFALFRGDWRALFRSTEWRVYIGIWAVGVLLITANVLGLHGQPAFEPVASATVQTMPEYSFGSALRAASFTAASLMSDTGFTTDDYDLWPHFSRWALVLLMVMGGCAGSTSGGLKIIRIVILAKMLYWRLESMFRPRTVRAVRVNDEIVDDGAQRAVYAYFALYTCVFAIASLLMCLVGLPVVSAVSSVAATINGCGPGLEFVGGAEDYHLVPAAGKMVLCVCMLMGRLEIYTILVLFLPSFWRHS